MANLDQTPKFMLPNSTIPHARLQHITQQSQDICITFIQRWPNVFDVGPTLHEVIQNVLCLLGL